MVPDRVIDRFKQRVGGDPDRCWNWPMAINSSGYGVIGWSEDGHKQLMLTHRLAWVLYRGEIQDGLTVDHLCRNRRCCNPRHLRLLTLSENSRNNGKNTKTMCPQGHPYSGPNLYVSPTTGHRECRICRRRNLREWHRGKKARST